MEKLPEVPDYPSRPQDSGHPRLLFAGLVGLSVIGGDSGRLVLRRLRMVARYGMLVCLALTFIAALVLAPTGNGLVLAVIPLFGAFGFAMFWCYVAAAMWLTRPEDENERRVQ